MSEDEPLESGIDFQRVQAAATFYRRRCSLLSSGLASTSLLSDDDVR